MVDRLLRGIDAVCIAAAWLSAALIAAVFLLGLSEIISRALFETSIAVAVEYTGYMVASALLLGAGWTLRDGGHIRVSLVKDRLPLPLAWTLDVAATIFALAVVAFFAWAMADYALATATRGIVSYFPSATPLLWPQALLALGPAVLTLALAGRLIRLLKGERP